MRDMNRMIPKAECKAALLSFLGLAAFTAVICAMELSTRHLQVREYLIEVAWATTFGALGGLMFGYVGRFIVTVVRHLIVTLFDGATQIAQIQIEGLLREAGE
jgi:hypothetical protein